MHIGTLPGLTEAFASLLEDPRASLIFERIQDQLVPSIKCRKLINLNTELW